MADVFDGLTDIVGCVGVGVDGCTMGAAVRKLIFRRKNIEKAS